jgi:L-2-hydroxyglutarate oxidase
MKIVGFRGDYYDLEDHAKEKVNNLIYPVPNPEFPFLGVHFTRMTDGSIECGPNAVFTFKREGYSKTDFSLKDTLDAITFSGTWRLFINHWKFGLNEYRRAFSKRLFLKELRKILPSLKMSDIKVGRSGVRAMALGKNGEVIDDFKIVKNEKNIHVLNAPSPSATACLSIADEIVKYTSESFDLKQ